MKGAAGVNWPSSAPGCLVVSCTTCSNDVGNDSNDDYVSCVCATNQFMLALHVEGIATQWVPPSTVGACVRSLRSSQV